MTRKNDDKKGNNEFEGMDKKEAEYSRKVEARFTKILNTTDDYKKANESHKRDKK